jgi:hypothetical protein
MFHLPWHIPLKKTSHVASWPSRIMKYLINHAKKPSTSIMFHEISPIPMEITMLFSHGFHGSNPPSKRAIPRSQPATFRAPAPRNMGSATSGGKPKVPRPLPPSAERPLGRQTQTEMPRGDLGMRCWKIDVLLLLNGSIVTYSSDSIFIE